MSFAPPIPDNEFERITALAELDIDYTAQNDGFKDLAKLAAKVAGTEISHVNLIDSYTQWTISNHGQFSEQVPREDTVCQFTIMGDDGFEVQDLSADDRFKDKTYVTDEPNFRFYYGIPLRMQTGVNIGALCVLDKQSRGLSPEKEELLKIIAEEIVNRLKTLKAINSLKSELADARETQRKVAHDIRGPLGGIIGLAQVIKEQGHENQIEEVLEFINMIYKSGRSILELADEILTEDKRVPTEEVLKSDQFNLLSFKDKLEKLYQPQAYNKQIAFTVSINPESGKTPFLKNKLLQIIGNLISNAIKFTPRNGKVSVELDLKKQENGNMLEMIVRDTGVGMDQQAIDNILNSSKSSTDGTSGEKGYGFGLALVKHLTESLRGTMNITSEPGNGTTFDIQIPQATN